VDLCLSIPSSSMNKKKGAIRKLDYWLRRGPFTDVELVLRARVPLVTCVHEPTGIECDIVVNNDLAVANSELLRSYVLAAPLRCCALSGMPCRAMFCCIDMCSSDSLPLCGAWLFRAQVRHV